MKRIHAGIAGGAGYTGGELIRLLLNHPQVDIAFVQSKSQAGNFIYEVHRDLLGDTDLQFSDSVKEADVLFLCLAHGESKKFLKENSIAASTRIIDLSQDFRLKPLNIHNGRTFSYGLPEWNKATIEAGHHVANPGCFATCIQLALLPLAAQQLLGHAVHISATTGSTGAGQALSPTNSFNWRQNNLSAYKVFEHQHLHEIRQNILQLQPNFEQSLYFIPQRGNFTRGIFATLHTTCHLAFEEIEALYRQAYGHSPFVHLSQSGIDLKQVVNTNKCFIALEKHGSQLVITAAIDNLLKGASGQAVQNMNLLFGINESSGLRLKASAF